MDFSHLLLTALLPSDANNTQRKSRPWLNYLTYVSGFIQFFCGIKMLVIILAPTELEFYLVDMYIIDSELQKYFFIAVVNIHISVAWIYLYWSDLNRQPERMACLSFFTPDLRQLCRHYHLDSTAAKKFDGVDPLHRLPFSRHVLYDHLPHGASHHRLSRAPHELAR